MWLRSIRKIKVLLWLRENGKQLRMAATLFAALFCVNLLMYYFLIARPVAGLKADEERFGELRQRHAEAVLFNKQKPLFTGILSGIPTQKDMPLLVKEIVQMAKNLHLAVDSINYDIPRRESGELASILFSFPVEGKYPDIKRFIYEVETSDLLIGIQDVSLESGKGTVKLHMKLMTYVRGK